MWSQTAEIDCWLSAILQDSKRFPQTVELRPKSVLRQFGQKYDVIGPVKISDFWHEPTDYLIFEKQTLASFAFGITSIARFSHGIPPLQLFS